MGWVDSGEVGGFCGLQHDDQSLWKLSPQIFGFLDNVDVLELHVRDDGFRNVLQHPHSVYTGLQ